MTTSLPRALLALALALTACGVGHDSSTQCDCVPPGELDLAMSAPATVVVASGPCTIDACRATDGGGGAPPDAGAPTCLSLPLKASSAGTCVLIATYADGKKESLTATFTESTGTCCAGLHAGPVAWTPVAPLADRDSPRRRSRTADALALDVAVHRGFAGIGAAHGLGASTRQETATARVGCARGLGGPFRGDPVNADLVGVAGRGATRKRQAVGGHVPYVTHARRLRDAPARARVRARRRDEAAIAIRSVQRRGGRAGLRVARRDRQVPGAAETLILVRTARVSVDARRGFGRRARRTRGLLGRGTRRGIAARPTAARGAEARAVIADIDAGGARRTRGVIENTVAPADGVLGDDAAGRRARQTDALVVPRIMPLGRRGSSAPRSRAALVDGGRRACTRC